MYFPGALLIFFHVAKATTEMKRSGIEVRVAQCGRVHKEYVAKAATEMERSGIEVRVAQCGRVHKEYVAKAATEMERSGIEVRAAQCGRGHKAYLPYARPKYSFMCPATIFISLCLASTAAHATWGVMSSRFLSRT